MAIPVPEPATALIVNGVKTGGTVAWKLWIAYDNQRERGILLRSALALAICDKRRSDGEIEDLAAQFETALRATSIPTDSKQTLGRRVTARLRKPLGRRGYRETPEMKVFGSTFGSHLSTWLRRSVDDHLIERLAAVSCHEERTVGGLVERFPDAFEEELFDERKATPFREQLIREMLLTDYIREEMTRRNRRRSAGRGTERALASVAASGGIAYAAANVLGANDPGAAAIGIGAAVLGALIGGTAWQHAGTRAARESRVTRPVLSWVAAFLAEVSGRRTTPEPRALEAQLYSVLGEVVEGRQPLPPGLLAKAADEAGCLYAELSTLGEEVLAGELAELEEPLRAAAADPRLGRQVFAGLFRVIAACDLNSDGNSGAADPS
jgi:hypothetical protein